MNIKSKYATLKVRQLQGEGKRLRPVRLFLNPLVYFLRYYFVRRMFLCGVPGFIQAVTGSIYTFVTEARMYQVTAAARDVAEDDRRASGL